jgi:hypothetical protein
LLLQSLSQLSSTHVVRAQLQVLKVQGVQEVQQIQAAAGVELELEEVAQEPAEPTVQAQGMEMVQVQ